MENPSFLSTNLYAQLRPRLSTSAVSSGRHPSPRACPYEEQVKKARGDTSPGWRDVRGKWPRLDCFISNSEPNPSGPARSRALTPGQGGGSLNQNTHRNLLAAANRLALVVKPRPKQPHSSRVPCGTGTWMRGASFVVAGPLRTIDPSIRCLRPCHLDWRLRAI